MNIKYLTKFKFPSYNIKNVVLASAILAVSSCKKLVEVPAPLGNVSENNVYSNDATAAAALTGIYTDMSMQGGSGSASLSGIYSISGLAGLSADEFQLFDGLASDNKLTAYYKNKLAVIGNVIAGSEHWSPFYSYIFRCNAAIEKLNVSTKLTPLVRQQLLGEAKFLRAFFYFYLVNMYGDVPLALTTDPRVNTQLARTPVTQVYQQVIQDLKEAVDLLSSNFLKEDVLSTSSERIRPTKWAAKALLARVYLYTGSQDNWQKAEVESTDVINNTSFSLLPLNNVFLKNSKETIWQLQPVTNDMNTADGQLLIIPSTGMSNDNPVKLSSFLLGSFESGDKRVILGNWVNRIIYPNNASTNDTAYYPFKYKVGATLGVTSPGSMSEYLMVLRLAEQYLIRAEARAQQSNISGAQSDLNAIRNRAGLSNTTANDKSSLLAAILQERKVELFSEWGHRWFDLKRTSNIDAVMSVVTPQKSNGAINWQPYQALYPIPLTDIQKDVNLIQNTGY